MERRDIAEKVSRDELFEITRSLLRAPSVNPPGDNRDCAEVTARALSREGITAELVPVADRLANVVATLEGTSPGPTLVFNGHLDVVPPGEDWTKDPWGGEFEDGKIYGRGAADMKGGVAAMIGSMIALQRAGRPFKGKLLFTAVCDEETGSDLGTVYLVQKKFLAGDFCIVSEPTTGWVELGNRGILWMEATIKGKACHAGRPQMGVNAIHHAARAIDAVSRMQFTERQEIFEIPTGSVSVTLVSGGTKLNVVPDRCTFGIDRRVLPTESGEEAKAQIRQAIEGALSEGAEFDLRVTKEWPPVLMDANHPLVSAVKKAYQEVQNRPPDVRGKSASTDASFIHGIAGIPIVLYGPGPSFKSHTADEYVELEEVVKASHIYTLATLDLLSD